MFESPAWNDAYVTELRVSDPRVSHQRRRSGAHGHRAKSDRQDLLPENFVVAKQHEGHYQARPPECACSHN